MYKKGFLLCICLFTAGNIWAKYSLFSPNQNLSVVFADSGGIVSYQLYGRDHQQLVSAASLGFDFRGSEAFNKNLFIRSEKRSTHDGWWHPVAGTVDSVRDHYNQMKLELTEHSGQKRKLWILVRAYDDGIAFRYEFPKEFAVDSLLITREHTSFQFAPGDSAWWIPADEFAYESLYRHTAISQIHSAATPITIHTTSGMWMAIHEAALNDYSEMYLTATDSTSGNFETTLWPWPDGIACRAKGSYRTPWRCIIAVADPGELMTSHLIENLNEPTSLKDVSWIRPIRFDGIWWGMHTGKYTWEEGPRHGATTARAKEYIDFASQNGFEGMLAEGWNKGWETWGYGKESFQDYTKPCDDFDIDEVLRYASGKKVNVVCHHETGGNIPEYERQLERALQWCEDRGIHYLKTGYAGTILPMGMHHHGQYMVRHFQRVVETAARHKICLDVHESIKPTGISRTWPNLLTQEAGRGNEWNATYKATPPSHSTILPFTRLLAGPFDYTPGIFKINHSPDKNKRLYTTLTHQLALYVVFSSPMMMISDMIENYQGQKALDFLRAVPASWNDTKVMNAVPGQQVCVARRSGQRWFVGMLANEKARQYRMPLNFLQSGQTYRATVFYDSPLTSWNDKPAEYETRVLEVTAQDTLWLSASGGGGEVVMIEPASRPVGATMDLQVFNKNAYKSNRMFIARSSFGDNKVIHAAIGKPVRLRQPFSEKYPASGMNALNDGIRGTLDFSAGGWQGYEGTDLEITIDLGSTMLVKKIAAGFLEAPSDWIFFPSEVEFFHSSNGFVFEPMGVQTVTGKAATDPTIHDIADFEVKPTNVTARYVKVRAKNIGVCPKGHPGEGKPAWIFSDEIQIDASELVH